MMSRHCSIQELLEVRNGEGSLGARTHVDECARCRDELDRIHQRVAALRALPSLNAPRDRWAVVRQSIVEQRRRLWWVGTGWVAAAAIALALGANGLLSWPAAREESGPGLQQLVTQAAQLDSQLVEVASRPRVVNGLAAIAIVDLEDQINAVDSRIGLIDSRVLEALFARENSAAPRRLDEGVLRVIAERDVVEQQLRQLLEERIILMDALVNTHDKRVIYIEH
jgi:hypothetical protein